jgi:hypothetical protein
MRWLVLSCLALLACGSVEQKRRTFPVEISSLAPSGENDFGWTVNVTSATARIDTVRFFEGKVLVSRRFRFDPYVLIGGSAWAHAGHYVPGEALGELLQSTDVDLLAASPVELGVAQAVTGEYGSVELGLKNAHVMGTATKGGTTVTFDTTLHSPAKPIEGVKFDRLVQDEVGRVHLAVKLQTWLSRVDFAAPFTADGAARNGFIRGVQDTSAYEVTWR